MSLYENLVELLEEERMSISSIARELKKQKIDQHRLILTGYLRALRDLDLLREEEIPPSKVYSLHSRPQDIYTILEARISDHPEHVQFPLAVYVLTKLFQRPCFQREIKQLEVIPREHPNVVISDHPKLEEFRDSIKRLDIPRDDIAFEIEEVEDHIVEAANQVLAGVLRDAVDLSGLYPKHKQTRLDL